MRCRPLLLALAMPLALSLPGAAGEGPVALQSADPSCRTTTTPPPIYVDCGNGTVTDNRTGLVWLAKADCFGLLDWHEAMESVAGLSDVDDAFCTDKGATQAECDCGLGDGSSPGEWRLPSVTEWQTMVGDALGQGGDPDCTASPPTITNDSGGGCLVSGPTSFSDVQQSSYWSSSTLPTSSGFAWLVHLGSGNLAPGTGKQDVSWVWPVRGGQ